ncbi:MAG: FKBP-type peptidyl-prolyl cis-trans isomerase [Paludibacteraceae bacterium]|nr:FKBP-type peptidyl-prolyl cis-trans isomerase [Paludibacteraceae bacterium]
MIEDKKVVKATYDLYIAGEEAGKEELMERATEEMPLVYCHGMGMMLQAFEDALAGKDAGDTFDFVIAQDDAYGPYEEEGVIELDKKIFCIDGVFDDEHVQVGAIVPMNTADGQIVKAQIIEIDTDKVTIDLNHPFAGEDLHFIGKILEVRDVTEGELKALTHQGCGGGCGGCQGGNCGDGGCNCNGGCQ